MRLLTVSAKNFGSYKDLTFDFQNQGLALVAGPTGSGKTTFMDVVPWALFGVTAKGGSVDEVRSWTATGTASVNLNIEIGITTATIVRQRSPNDLYYYLGDLGVPRRGKDMNDTQQQIDTLLGLDADRYLTSAYYHSFSQTVAFFTLAAKQRRQITEQMVDLSLATSITEKTAVKRKEIKAQKDELIVTVVALDKELVYRGNELRSIPLRQKEWNDKQTEKIRQLHLKYTNFESHLAAAAYEYTDEHTKKRVELEYDIADMERSAPDASAIGARLNYFKEMLAECRDDVCPTCGNNQHADNKLGLTKNLHLAEQAQAEMVRHHIALKQLRIRLDKHNKKLNSDLDRIMAPTNVYEEQHALALKEVNPFDDQVRTVNNAIAATQEERTTAQRLIDDLSEDLADLELLDEANTAFRAKLIQTAVHRIEAGTNKLLTDHFDGEIRIELTANEKDKLDVTIYKDGNTTSYGRLSKGQQQLLKMTFAITVMRIVGMHSETKITSIFLDELGEGLDDELKLKMYGLLQELSGEYESVFCIDHNEGLKSMFVKRYDVSLIDGVSHLAEA